MGVYASSNRSDPSHMDRSKFTLAKFPFSKDGGVLMVISPSSPLLPFSPLFSSSLNYILQAFDYLDDYTPSEYFAVMSSSRNSYGYIYTSDFSVSLSSLRVPLALPVFLSVFICFKSLLILL